MDTPVLPSLGDEHREFLRRTARGMLAGLPDFGIDASDAVQQAMMKAFERIDQYAGATQASFRTWLKTILYHVLIAEIRRAARRPGVAVNRAIVDDSVGRLEELILAADTPPQSRASRGERDERLAQEIALLPEDQREVVKLRVIDGLSVKQAAVAMGRTTASTAGLYSRAMKALKGKLPDDLANPS